METNEQDKFKELITLMAENYDQEFTESTVKLWWNMFKPFSINAFESALYSHIGCPDAGMFSPKPANIMKFLKGTTKANDQNVSNKAEIAWASIEGQVSSIGSYQSPTIDDRQAMAALKAMGGWIQLCASTIEQLTWKKKEFMDIYKTFEQTPVEMLPDNMPGRIELEQHKATEANQMNGLMKGLEDRQKVEG